MFMEINRVRKNKNRMRQRMEPRTLLDFMGVAERLKCNMRHSRTAENRRESVAEHTYRLCVFAWLVKKKNSRIVIWTR